MVCGTVVDVIAMIFIEVECRNKFCFTGGYIETSVSLPGVNNIAGFWPAV